MFALSRFLLLASLIIPIGAFAAGAIAVDDEEGEANPGYGIATGASTREEAGRWALAECRKAGNKNCKVMVRFDKCGAYAASKNYEGVGWGSSLTAAKLKAMEECGQGACKIIAADCE